jgi:hypothetical protein
VRCADSCVCACVRCSAELACQLPFFPVAAYALATRTTDTTRHHKTRGQACSKRGLRACVCVLCVGGVVQARSGCVCLWWCMGRTCPRPFYSSSPPSVKHTRPLSIAPQHSTRRSDGLIYHGCACVCVCVRGAACSPDLSLEQKTFLIAM